MFVGSPSDSHPRRPTPYRERGLLMTTQVQSNIVVFFKVSPCAFELKMELMRESDVSYCEFVKTYYKPQFMSILNKTVGILVNTRRKSMSQCNISASDKHTHSKHTVWEGRYEDSNFYVLVGFIHGAHILPSRDVPLIWRRHFPSFNCTTHFTVCGNFIELQQHKRVVKHQPNQMAHLFFGTTADIH